MIQSSKAHALNRSLQIFEELIQRRGLVIDVVMIVIVEHLYCVRNCTKHLTYINMFNPFNNPMT